jgi:hypothetical protein
MEGTDSIPGQPVGFMVNKIALEQALRALKHYLVKCHSTNASQSSSTYYSRQNGKQPKPDIVPVSNALLGYRGAMVSLYTVSLLGVKPGLTYVTNHRITKKCRFLKKKKRTSETNHQIVRLMCQDISVISS